MQYSFESVSTYWKSYSSGFMMMQLDFIEVKTCPLTNGLIKLWATVPDLFVVAIMLCVTATKKNNFELCCETFSRMRKMTIIK